ncbi:MAG TPA: Gfo/Idh/MocA family oxidoreductase [Prolixibacteraceae bacterium]|nr:Gfo/Idh/MocA family oxidoreductase [Prolixibacteraceae bacterium]
MEKETTTRREFIAKSAATVAGVSVGLQAFSSKQGAAVFGANDRIRMGFIGIGNRGSQLMQLFMGNPEVEVAALCDVYEPYLLRDHSQVSPRYIQTMGGQIPKMGETFGKPPKSYRDYRKLLEDKEVDAVCIATPDHWHALQTIAAIEAGKDVYVEKPLTITLLEGRKMVEAQARSRQVVAVGLNRRGSSVYQKLAKEIPAGKIGKVTVARAFRINNMFPGGIGKLTAEIPPAGFNWDMWLGPRAIRPYQYNIAPYMFRWWKDYSSQMGNWGVHFMDVIRWMMGETAPVAISAHGGKLAVDDDRDIPDTMQVTFEFASGAIASFCIYEASSGGLFPYGEVELRGTKGTLYAGESGYRIQPASKGQFQSWDKMVDAEEFDARNEALGDGSSRDSTANLVRNFLHCVKTRETPLCTLEEGHRSTSFAHLANIALATKQRLQWDPVAERFTNSEEANNYLHYEYRKPWKL